MYAQLTRCFSAVAELLVLLGFNYGKGYKHVVSSNNLFSQYCIRNGKRYVKCDVCSANYYIEGDKSVTVKPHSQHDDQLEEVKRLQCC